MKKTFSAVCLAVSGLAGAQLPGGDGASSGLYTIPGIVNAAGRNNTRFVSDLALTNPGSSSVDVLLSFVPAGSLEDQQVSLSPGRTVVWRNVLQQLWGGAEASGAVLIMSEGPLLIRARTYNTAATGTFGVALPAVPEGGLLVSGDRAHCLWISQSPDGAKDYRTNVAVAYASVVDNVTGDSSLFKFEPLPAGPQDVLVNGVARANGKNNTYFRTDGRFYNPGTQDVTVKAAFHASGASNPAPGTATFTVSAGRILDVTDVLGMLLSLPVGSAGALRFTSDAPVGILCRTSNVDPTGAKPGTFGAQQKPVPLLSFLSSADAGALITGVRQNTAYRTNFALAAGRDGATAQFTLKSAKGLTAASAAQTLGPWGWSQTAVDKLFPGTAVPEDAQVLVKVTQGSADVFDSSVDNASGDSVVTPAQGLPVDIPSSATIGPDGGSVRSDDGRLTLKIPSGALPSPSNVTLQAVPNTETNGVGSGYSLTIGGASFTKAPLATFRYSATDLVGSGAEYLVLAYRSAGALHAFRGLSCDTTARTISAPLAGVPVAGSGTPSTSARAVVEADTGVSIVPILNFKVSPGKAGVLAGGIVNFKVTGFNQIGDGPLTPADFSVGSTWELLGLAPGQLYSSGGTATYVAPPEVGCVEPITVFYRYDNPYGFANMAVVSITLLPRQWELFAIAAVEANLCNWTDDSPRFELTTDRIKVVMTLVEDPAGEGFQFIPAEVGALVSEGTLGSISWCPSKDCKDSWVVPPSTKLAFYGGTESSGGWENYRGSFYLRNWGLVLGNSSLYKWSQTCPSGTIYHDFILPNLGFVDDPWKLKLEFDPPNPENGCATTQLIDWKKWRFLIKVPIDNKDIYNGTGFLLSLHPR